MPDGAAGARPVVAALPWGDAAAAEGGARAARRRAAGFVLCSDLAEDADAEPDADTLARLALPRRSFGSTSPSSAARGAHVIFAHQVRDAAKEAALVARLERDFVIAAVRAPEGGGEFGAAARGLLEARLQLHYLTPRDYTQEPLPTPPDAVPSSSLPPGASVTERGARASPMPAGGIAGARGPRRRFFEMSARCHAARAAY